MIKTAIGLVISIEYCDDEIIKFTAMVDGKEEKCINYNKLTASLQVGDMVLLNITAVDLRLGSGGYHFVIANMTNPNIDNIDTGHIMKLKYTPFQINCMTAEAQESQYHDIFNAFESLKEFPVIVGSLHSMLAPCSIFLKRQRPHIKICYIMTDGGALPLYLCDTVKRLKEDLVLDSTITCGNSFGGDLECINIYTALIAAKEIVKADAAIVCMGPGISGTNTKYGFSGIEQGYIIDAVNKLGGYAIMIPRISFVDPRERHYGLSHHSVTVLKNTCCTKANLAIPKLKNEERMAKIIKQIKENKIESLHNINYVDLNELYEILKENKCYFDKMGKSLAEDEEYFLTSAAAGKLALDRLN